VTFKEWLIEYLPDWESEYSGTLKGLEDAWNGAIDAVTQAVIADPEGVRCDPRIDEMPFTQLYSHEFNPAATLPVIQATPERPAGPQP
jgi:hypothetical protein